MPATALLAKLSKLKVVQGGVTVVGTPVVVGLQSMQIVSSPVAELFAVIGVHSSMLHRKDYCNFF